MPNTSCSLFTNSGGKLKIVPLPCSASDSINPFVNVNVTQLGWGKDADNSPAASQFLKYGRGVTIANAQCRFVYGSIILPSNICVKTSKPLASICNGDSGMNLEIN